MKVFGRLLNALVAVALVFALSGGDITNRVYACSGMSSSALVSVSEAPCPCCATPAQCCPTAPMPSDSQPLDAGSSMGEKFTAKTLNLLPIRLLANANFAGPADFAPQTSVDSNSKNYVSPLRLYLVFRALLI